MSQTTRKFQIPFHLHICDSRKVFHNFVDFTKIKKNKPKKKTPTHKQCTYNMYCIYGKTNNYINDAASLKVKLVFKCITFVKIFNKRLS